MKILHIIIDLNVGGAELMLERLTEAGTGDNRQHRIISLSGMGTVGKRMAAAGMSVEALMMQGPWQVFSVMWRVRRIVRKYDPDLIQTWMYHADLIGGMAARLAGYRAIIWNVRTNAAPRTAFPWKTRCLQRVSAIMAHFIPFRVITVSSAALQSHAQIGYPRDRMVTIGNGFAIPDLKDNDVARQRIRGELGLTEDHCAIGMIGRFNSLKGHENFVRAAGQIAEALPQTTFIIIGRNCDQRNETLAGWLAEAGLQQRVLLLGERNDIDDCLAAMDVFCLPSLVEGTPNVLGEAMAAGKACVTTSAGGAGDLLAGHGRLVPVDDSAALAQAMAEVARMSMEERDRLGRAARQHIAQTFSMEQVLSQYARFYDSVLSQLGLPSHSLDELF